MSWAFNTRGTVNDTIAKARAWKPYDAGRLDVRKVTLRFIRQAEGLERQAQFARDEGNLAKARECLAHAAGLRIEAQSAVG